MKVAEVRFYFDADILGLSKLLASLRPNSTFPRDPVRSIQRRIAEVKRSRPRSHHGRLVSADATTVWAQLEVFMNQWRAIEKLHGRPGPFIYRASRTALTPVDLNGWDNRRPQRSAESAPA